MQLIFKRYGNDTMSVEIKDGVSTKPFDYVEMIRKIIENQKLEETIFEGDILDEEKAKVNEMVEKINQAIPGSENSYLNNPLED